MRCNHKPPLSHFNLFSINGAQVCHIAFSIHKASFNMCKRHSNQLLKKYLYVLLLLLLLLVVMIWQSPGLPGWRKVNFITVSRRPYHPNIHVHVAAGLCCLTTSPGFIPTLCEKWSGFFYVHRVFLSYTRDRRLKVSSERLGTEDKAPCPILIFMIDKNIVNHNQLLRAYKNKKIWYVIKIIKIHKKN